MPQEAIKPITVTPLPTLRQRLLQHVLTPLFFVRCIGTATTVAIAYHFTLQAFDRALLDDAYALSAHVRLTNGEPTLELSSRELASLLFDQTERVYFAVARNDGSLLAGHAGLLNPATDLLPSAAGEAVANAKRDSIASFAFSDRVQQGAPVRVVVLAATLVKPWTIMVAQTTVSRTRLIERLLLFAVVPQALLLFALAAWLLRAIGRDLAPLNRLRHALQQRGTQDLSAIAASGDSRDVVQLTQAANALLARVQLGIQAQREFTGNVAHELRNPLAGIRALAEYGLRQSDATVLREQLQAIARSETRASHLIDQLLALALADEAQSEFALLPVCINDVVENEVADLLRRHANARIDLAVSGLDHTVMALGNEALIKGCLANFLDNAVAYGWPADGTPIQITISVDRDVAGERVSLSVTDNGSGLSPELARDLKQRWTRGQGSERVQGGAGLGLAIVTRYAELLNATFTLDSVAEHSGLRARLGLRAMQPTQ